jgi:prepilin-type processing-associated H-X9-DG protein
MKQLGTATLMYTGDNGDTLYPYAASGKSWFSATVGRGFLVPYLATIKKTAGAATLGIGQVGKVWDKYLMRSPLSCPSVSIAEGAASVNKWGTSALYTYGYNQQIAYYPRRRKLTKFKHVSQTMILGEIKEDLNSAPLANYLTYPTARGINFRHGGDSANLLFGDGHAKNLRSGETSQWPRDSHPTPWNDKFWNPEIQ